MNKLELARFLRHRREARRPAEVGLRVSGRRRTPGLRREEVAWLAGVSTNYYERLEQARAPRPSTQVLAALGTALRLTEAEGEHLARLAGQAPPVRDEPVPDGVLRLLDRLGPVPAYVVDERYDIVAWNSLAAGLIADFAAVPPEERNVLRMSMRGDRCSSGNDEFARQAAADLRLAAGRHPDDPRITALTREYAEFSADFATSWTEHDVQTRPTLRKRIEHPDLGGLDLEAQVLHAPNSAHRLIFLTAEPGTPAYEALLSLNRAQGVQR
ncbi:helix-turn-helix transcriptional regulator [Saccharopolyspora sp. WRP15-2]|uniref:Helix-turn-helix transcriptional regulator n=1 Tax=Saccharopolyspora oryzae TaxID=2997343 RepID=A0ABT4V0D3_9PSEU|nr:helix-turn-helix transcriptional regulator [Saccharopolyspora oryzae]MDA3627428.1 helix-turn-helix transcriptional regulator [Saccharopolyspora oryzae]